MASDNRVRALRLQAELTQEELAVRAGVSLFTISRIENRRNTPTRATQRAIARALGATVEKAFPAKPKRRAS